LTFSAVKAGGCTMSCENETKKPKGYHFIECGLDYVYLVNGYELEDDPDFGECLTIHNGKKLHKEIAKAVLLYKPEFEGQEVHFFRSLLRLTQEQLAKLLGMNSRQVLRWENDKKNKKIPPAIDGLLRIIVWEMYLDVKNAVNFFKKHREERTHYKMLEVLKMQEQKESWKYNLDVAA
jgi:DNA-binding transcriptional regulator YiaG